MSGILKINVGNYIKGKTAFHGASGKGGDNLSEWYVLGPFDYCNVRAITLEPSAKKGILSNLALSTGNGKNNLDETENAREFTVFYDDAFSKGDAWNQATTLWNEKGRLALFQFVVFIHGVSDLQTTSEALFEDYKNCVEKSLKTQTQVEYALCRSLDCCDAVLLLYGNDCDDLINVAYNLTKMEKVGHTYSLVMLRHGVQQTPTNENAFQKKISLLVRAQILSEEDERALEKIVQDVFAHSTQEKALCVIPGDEDVLVYLDKVRVQSAVEFERRVENSQLSCVGSTYISREKPKADPTQGVPKPVFYSERWKTFLEQIACTDDSTWKVTLAKFVNELCYLEQSGYAQDVFYQVVRAFDSFLYLLTQEEFLQQLQVCEEVEEETGERVAIEGVSIEGVNALLRGLLSLIQQSTNLDLQFVQFPSRAISPIRYPAKLATAYTYFCYDVSELLTYLDSQEDHAELTRRDYLLVPKLCSRIQYRTPFGKIENKNWQENDTERYKSLISIDAPVACLDLAELTLLSFAHEVSHAVGHRFRKRKFRAQMFVKCLVNELLYEMELPLNNQVLVDELEMRIQVKYARLAPESLHLFQMEMTGYDIAKELCVEDGDYLFSLCLKYSESYREQQKVFSTSISTQEKEKCAQELYTLRQKYKENIKRYSQNIQDDIAYLVDVFREAYADVSGITLLDASFEEYVECFYQTEQIALPFKTKSSHQYAIFDMVDITRVQCVMWCMQGTPKWAFAELSDEEKALLEQRQVANATGDMDEKMQQELQSAAKAYAKNNCERIDGASDVVKAHCAAFLEQFFYAHGGKETNQLTARSIRVVSRYLLVCQEALCEAIANEEDGQVNKLKKRIRDLRDTMCSTYQGEREQSQAFEARLYTYLSEHKHEVKQQNKEKS